MRHVLLAVLLLAGCPKKHTAPPAEVPPEPMGLAPDSDEDGVSDHLDPCPDVPGSENGCPSAKQGDDRDGDGIKNDRDKCPDDPEDKDAFQDTDGCPDPDNDGDGFADASDRCPNESQGKRAAISVSPKGCPDPDSDGDGILDFDDTCPRLPETKNGYQDEDGCPDDASLSNYDFSKTTTSPPPSAPKPKPKPTGPADRDKDGIPDDKDRCPDEPETINGKTDGDGCPD